MCVLSLNENKCFKITVTNKNLCNTLCFKNKTKTYIKSPLDRYHLDKPYYFTSSTTQSSFEYQTQIVRIHFYALLTVN